MPNLSVKDVPETWAEALRQRAVRNHRSLQGELMAIIEQAVIGAQAAATPADAQQVLGAPRVVGHDRHGHPIVQRGWKTIEQLAEERRTLYPEPIQGGPLAVDIIREDRDSR